MHSKHLSDFEREETPFKRLGMLLRMGSACNFLFIILISFCYEQRAAMEGL